MCQGFGCNAVGVVGCRIIDSPRERLIAMVTNNFVPCNGRLPQPQNGKQKARLEMLQSRFLLADFNIYRFRIGNRPSHLQIARSGGRVDG